MMARLVALMASIRPTVRRVTETLATPASTNINSDAQAQRRLDLLRELVEIVDVFSDQQMTAVRERIKRRPQRWTVGASGFHSRALKSPHPLEPFNGRWPTLRLPASGANEGSASR